jgi:hypothetical protein
MLPIHPARRAVAILATMLSLVAASCAEVRGEGEMSQQVANQRFIVDGGDGWNEFFYSNQVFEIVETDWFDNTVNDRPAILARGVGGDFDGEYFAFTARTMVNFPNFYFENGWASILVHQIEFPANTDSADAYNLIWGRGMGLIVMMENGQPIQLNLSSWHRCWMLGQSGQ